MNAHAVSLPPLIVSDLDHQRLVSLLETDIAARHPRTRDVLRSELERAAVVPPDLVPPDVVTMGARVLYADSFGRCAEIELVYPWDTIGGWSSSEHPLAARSLDHRPS